MSKLERILVLVLGVFAVAILSGTVWALAIGAPARKVARKAVPDSALVSANPDAAQSVYDQIGRVRAVSQDGAVVVAHIAFPVDARDRVFMEELRGKRRNLKQASEAFFASRTSEQLDPRQESVIKAALRDELNTLLVTGSIQELYLAELTVLK